jgi:hypothetical protein
MNHPLVLEGTWEEIQSHSAQLAGQRVRVTVIPQNGSNDPASASKEGTPRMIYLGMFSGPGELTDEDFRSAEVRGHTNRSQ